MRLRPHFPSRPAPAEPRRGRRLASVWAVSSIARATIIPVSVAGAVSLDGSASALALVALAAVGFVNTLSSFLAAAADAAEADGEATLDRTGRRYMAAVALVTAVISSASTSHGLQVMVLLSAAILVQNTATYRRQSALLNGDLLRPYGSLVLRNLLLATSMIVLGQMDSQRVGIGVAAAFLLAGICELRAIQPRRNHSSFPPHRRSRPVSIELMIGYTLSCLLSWLIRTVVAVAGGVAALRVLEYGDRFSYLAVSSVLGGLAVELQRRWSQHEAGSSAIRREALTLCAVLGSVGVTTGLVSAAAAPLVFEDLALTDTLAIVLTGLVAGGTGLITIAQRYIVVVGDQTLLGRRTLLYQGAGALGILICTPLGLVYGLLAMTIAAWGLAIDLMCRRE